MNSGHDAGTVGHLPISTNTESGNLNATHNATGQILESFRDT